MNTRSQTVYRNASQFKPYMDKYIPVITTHNNILQQMKQQRYRSVSQKTNRLASDNIIIKHQAITTHYCQEKLDHQLVIKEKLFKSLKDNINDLAYQKQQRQRKLQKLQEIISQSIHVENIDKILFLENRLDEQKLKVKEAQQIQDFYQQSVHKLLEEQRYHEVSVDKSTQILQVFVQDCEYSQEIYENSIIQNQITEQQLELVKQQLINIQLTNKTQIEDRKYELRQSLKIQPLDIIKNYTFENINPDQKATDDQEEFIFKLVKEKLIPSFNVKQPLDIFKRARMHKNNLSQEKQDIELKLSLLDIEIRDVMTELKHVKFDFENNMAKIKSNKNAIEKERQTKLSEQIYLKQKVSQMTESYEKISDFFRDLVMSLQLINPQAQQNIIPMEDSQNSVQFVVNLLEIKLTILDELLKIEPLECLDSLLNKQTNETVKKSHRKFAKLEEDDDVYVEIFGKDTRQFFNGDLPNNIKIQFNKQSYDILDGVYKSGLNSDLRKTRGFRLDTHQIKKESTDFAQNIINEQLRRDGYL
ncbi:hypothetical protein SS50377_22139 [Spironucleus salmonicida]|uniref:Uncharacterized protein n=1 Tax=Spironucleus salmonicida TaxID=348837 RepID=V6LPR9_9EUKA|nr:hypothetical protein SS50377_22139 [Spironucleus salmonicida]|eukprot:EST45701.1 Hypothetical protein SS50377_14272 [Spironucleus salmonicida]